MTVPGTLPGGMLGVAALGSVAITALIVVLLLAVALSHAGRVRGEARDARRRAELTPVIHDLLDGEDVLPDVAGAPAVLDEVVLHLLPQLRGSDRKVLQDVLVSRGVVQRAAAALTARAAWRRGRAAMLLGSTGSTEQTPGLVALRGDRSPDVRSAAARALGKAGDAGAAPALLATLTADRALPSGIVGMALLDLGTEALPVLREALVTGPPPVGALAAGLLGLHGDLSATPALGVVLRDGEGSLLVRRAAAEALGRIAAPQATDALAGVLAFARDPLLRRAAAEALGRIGDPSALPALVAGLAADDLVLRATCADALVATGPEGRTWLEQLAAGTGPGALAARGALDAVAVRPRRLQAVPAR